MKFKMIDGDNEIKRMVDDATSYFIDRLYCGINTALMYVAQSPE
jgi:hypothetical protein